MKERDFKQLGNFIIRDGGKDMSHYYRVKTSYPLIEWKFRPGSFMYALISEYRDNPTAINAETMKTVLVAMYYVCTAQDAEMIKLVYGHLIELQSKKLSEDKSDMDEVKNDFYAKKILSSMGDNKK